MLLVTDGGGGGTLKLLSSIYLLCSENKMSTLPISSLSGRGHSKISVYNLRYVSYCTEDFM